MPDREVLIVQKATLYDILRILEQTPDKMYTVKEINDIFDSYISAESRKIR